MILTKNENSYYEVRFKGKDGKYHSRTTHKKSKVDAMQVIQEACVENMETAGEIGILSHQVAAAIIHGQEPVTVTKAVNEWERYMHSRRLSASSISNGILYVKAWATFAKSHFKPVTSLSVASFDDWINSQESKVKLGTRRVMLSSLRSFCRFCFDKGWIQGNPANLVCVDMSILSHTQKETLKRDCFTDQEVERLIQETAPGGSEEDPFWNAAVIIGRYTGLRLGDIASLEWDCLNMSAGTLAVWTTKRDRRVALPLTPDILAETFATLERKHPVYLFNRQRILVTDPKSRHRLSAAFSVILGNLGIKNKSFHCLRATYISDCCAKGIPLEHISQAVGHWNPATTMGYIRPL
jgi:integrase